MVQTFRADLRVDSVLKQHRSMRMTQIVKKDLRQLGLFGQVSEGACDSTRRDRLAVLLAADKICVQERYALALYRIRKDSPSASMKNLCIKLKVVLLLVCHKIGGILIKKILWK